MKQLFEIVERFVVLNETAYRMLVADGAPSGSWRSIASGFSQAASRASRAPTSGHQDGAFRLRGRLHP
jgi:hypothetical protein